MDYETIYRLSERISCILSSLCSLFLIVYFDIAFYNPVVFGGLFLLLWCFIFFVFFIVRLVIMEILYCCMVEEDFHINEIALPIISRPDEECSICLEPCDKCVKLECGHHFHIDCINDWFEEQQPNASCPNCRTQV